MRARNLSLVCIDDVDQNQLDLASYHETFFNIVPIRGIISASTFLAARSIGRDHTPVDLLLIDLNMIERKEDHGTWEFGAPSSEIVPYGPLLALPFLNVAPHAQFLPYSEFWDRNEVRTNGYVRFSLGLILSAIRGRAVAPLDAYEEIRKDISKAKEPFEALTTGLVRMRRQIRALAWKKCIRLHSVDRLIDELYELADDGVPKVPLSSIDGAVPLTVDWTYQDGEVDRVSVSSLFADVLEFKSRPTPDRIRAVADMLKGWLRQTHPTRAPTNEQLYSAAMEVMDQCARQIGKDYHDDFLAHMVERNAFVTQFEGDPYLLMRTVLLFGWVYAWHQKIVKRRTKLKDHIKEIFDHSPNRSASTAQKRYPRYLGDEDGAVVSYELHRTPFSPAEINKGFVPNSYSLLKNEPAFLRRRDRMLCRQFAERGLPALLIPDGEKFRELNPWKDRELIRYPYPWWMTDSNFSELRFGLQKPPASRRRSTSKTKVRRRQAS